MYLENSQNPAIIAEQIQKLSAITGLASATDYDNTASGLEADNVQEAIDELVTDLGTIESKITFTTLATVTPLENEKFNEIMLRVQAAFTSDSEFCLLKMTIDGQTSTTFNNCRWLDVENGSNWFSIKASATELDLYVINITSSAAAIRKFAITEDSGTAKITITNLSSGAAPEITILGLNE